jgi:hypothetical protein
MWFAASLLFKSVHVPSGARPALWEESIRLIHAATEADAQKEAERIGRAEKVAYQAQSDLVFWTFEGVERLFAIDDDQLLHGTELFSRFLRDSEVSSLLTPFDEDT